MKLLADASHHNFLDDGISSVLSSLHVNLPDRPSGDVDALFRIPPEAEMILTDPTLVDYLSEKGLSSKELLRRCNSYLDTHVPNASCIFSSLHLTSSVLSGLTITDEDQLGEEGLDKDGGECDDLTSDMKLLS